MTAALSVQNFSAEPLRPDWYGGNWGRLVFDRGRNCWYWRRSWWFYCRCWGGVMLGVGLALAAAGAIGSHLWFAAGCAALLAMITVGMAIWLWLDRAGGVFDLECGLYYRGVRGSQYREDSTPFAECKALLLVENYSSLSGPEFFSGYELNLVAENHRRIYLASSLRRYELENDASTVAALLRIPLLIRDESGWVPMADAPAESGRRIRKNESLLRWGGGMLLLSGVLFYFMPLGMSYWRLAMSQDWVAVPAVIDRIEVDSDYHRSGEAARIETLFHYEFAARRYSGARYDFFRSDFRSPWMIDAMHQEITALCWRKGTTVTAWVDPVVPESAVLIRRVPASAWCPGVLPLLLVGLGLVFLWRR